MSYLVMINDDEYINIDKIESIRVYAANAADTEHAMVEMDSGEQFRVEDVTKFFNKMKELNDIQFGHQIYRGCNYVPE